MPMEIFAPASSINTDSARNCTIKKYSTTTSSAQLTVPAGKMWRVLCVHWYTSSSTNMDINGIQLGQIAGNGSHHWGSRGFYLYNGSIIVHAKGALNVGNTTAGLTTSSPIGFWHGSSPYWDVSPERPFMFMLKAGDYLQAGGGTIQLDILVEEFDA